MQTSLQADIGTLLELVEETTERPVRKDDVGIHEGDPAGARLGDPHATSCRYAPAVIGNDPVGVSAGDLERPICGPTIDDDDLGWLLAGNGRQALLEERLRVPYWDHD
jgi:hypothetical protein